MPRFLFVIHTMPNNFSRFTRYNAAHTRKMEVNCGFYPEYSHEVLQETMMRCGVSLYTNNRELLYQFGYADDFDCDFEDCGIEGYRDQTIRLKYLWALKQGHRVFLLNLNNHGNDGRSFHFERIVKSPSWQDILANGIAIVRKDQWAYRSFAETYVLRILEEKLSTRVNAQVNETLFQAGIWFEDGVGFGLPFSRLHPEEAFRVGQEEFPEICFTEANFRLEKSYCRKDVPEIAYSPNSDPMVVCRTEELSCDSRYVLIPNA